MKAFIAMFKSEFGNAIPLECRADGTSWADDDANYSRLTDSIEVEFRELPNESRISMQVAFWDKQEERARIAFNKAMNDITKARTELLGTELP